MAKVMDVTESGATVYSYEDQKPVWQAPEYGDELLINKLNEHIEKYLGKVDTVWHEIVSDTTHVDVHYIAPTPERNFHILVTTGMSYIPMQAPEECQDWRYAELLICLPPEWPISEEAFKDDNNYWPVWWLKMLARFPHQYGAWISWGHTIPNGQKAEPYGTNTKLGCALLMAPTKFAEEFNFLEIDEERKVHFMAVVPLYKEEMEFKLKNGLEALTERFEKHNIDELIQLDRKNVCKKSFWLF